MKFLTLIRHAKSSRDAPVSDELRPLNARGLQNAPAMGKYLDATFRFAPDIIVSSPAVRAMHTAQLIADAIGIKEWKIKEDQRIYEAPVPSLLAVIRDQPDEFAHVCLVGHNPGMENLTNWLCGSHAVVDVVTCAVLMLELDIASWQQADEGKARLREYVYPTLIGLGKEED
jgi:phosphohistidine phosphatase